MIPCINVDIFEVIKVGFEAHINKHEEMKHICFLMDWLLKLEGLLKNKIFVIFCDSSGREEMYVGIA